MNIHELLDFDSNFDNSSDNIINQESSSVNNFQDFEKCFDDEAKKNNVVKPKKYDIPPIWAQEWSVNMNHFQSQKPDDEFYYKKINVTFGNNKSFQKSTNNIKLECSVSGTIPSSSLTRSLAKWLIVNFSNIKACNRKYVELEIKFGKIIDKENGCRLNLNVNSECLYQNKNNVFFDMQVKKDEWKEINLFLQELENKFQFDLKNSNCSERGNQKKKFNLIKTDTTDEIYSIDNQGFLKSIRVTKANDSQLDVFQAIEKQRISDVYIFNPNSSYDFKISLSLEIPLSQDLVNSFISNITPSKIRRKKRNSWVHLETITKFDLTMVTTIQHLMKKKQKIKNESLIHYEIELEFKLVNVFNTFDTVIKTNDNSQLEDLIQIFINNARILNDKITDLNNAQIQF